MVAAPNMILKVFVLVLLVLSLEFNAHGPCDKIENMVWVPPIESPVSFRTCTMGSTGIGSTDFLITSGRDETVKIFYAGNNENLEFLPKNLGEKFPNLMALVVDECSVKAITKANFKGITRLQFLEISKSHLEQIDDDTFDYIPTVEKIWLDGNRIKNLNSRVFARLNKLARIDLRNNVCIDELFDTAERIADMPRLVNAKCGSEATKN